jgi:hypothetical protein
VIRNRSRSGTNNAQQSVNGSRRADQPRLHLVAQHHRCQRLQLGAGAGGVDAWFNPGAFAVPANGTFGNLGRNAVIGPGVFNWDASIQKTFRPRERLPVVFRAEFFNVFDHINYWGADTSMASARFGQVNATTDRRTSQAMLRLTF